MICTDRDDKFRSNQENSNYASLQLTQTQLPRKPSFPTNSIHKNQHLAFCPQKNNTKSTAIPYQHITEGNELIMDGYSYHDRQSVQGHLIDVTYDTENKKPKSRGEEFDMVIIAPQTFKSALNKLVTHKNAHGVKTFIKTTGEIYWEYKGVDKPEQIKKYIHSAIEEHNITYVLLVGGLKSKLYANPREDKNYGVAWWHVPVRYNNFYDDPEHPLSFEKKALYRRRSEVYYASPHA